MSSNENTWKDYLVSLLNLSPALGKICINKNVHLIMQHPSLGSMTEGPTDTSEILIPMPRPGQELSIYICLNPVKTAGFMHPKWEGCIVINSPIFVVVCKEHFVLPKFRQKLSMDKNQHQIKKKNNRVHQRTSHKHMHWSSRVHHNTSCFRIDWKRIQQIFWLHHYYLSNNSRR